MTFPLALAFFFRFQPQSPNSKKQNKSEKAGLLPIPERAQKCSKAHLLGMSRAKDYAKLVACTIICFFWNWPKTPGGVASHQALIYSLRLRVFCKGISSTIGQKTVTSLNREKLDVNNYMGSQHPSPNVKNPLRIRAGNWLEIITSRDAESACFQGSQTSCTEIISGVFLPKFGRKRSHHVMDASC